jgi:hypothetical protein
MVELTNEYRLVTGKVSIKTPFTTDISEVKNIVIEKTDRSIKSLSIYPNGFVIYFDQTSNDIIVRTNFPLKEDEDGSFEVILS